MLSSVSQVSATTDAFKCLVDFFPPIFYAKTQQGSLNAAIIKSPFTNSLKKKKVTNMCKTMRQAECICSVQCSWVLCFISCLFFYYFFFQVPALALSSLCFQLYLAFLDFQHRIYVLRTYVPFQRTLAQPLLASEYSTLCGFFPFRLLA